MIQQINLYQQALREQNAKPAINKYFSGLLAVLFLLIGVSIYLVLSVKGAESDLLAAKQQLMEAETRVQLLQVQYPKKQISTLLKQEVSRSQNMLGDLTQVIKLLTDKSADQTQGFSRYFSALARQSIPEVWLTNIAINAPQQSLELQGSSYNAGKIPVLLQRLKRETVFQGKSFVKLIILPAKETDKQIDFTVSTITETLEQTSHD